jgi:hypothetical protein
MSGRGKNISHQHLLAAKLLIDNPSASLTVRAQDRYADATSSGTPVRDGRAG